MAAIAVVSSSPHHSRRPSRVANTSAHDLETVSNPDDAIGAAQDADVYPLLRLISHDIRITIDTALSYEELIGHELNFAIVRPLAVKYARLKSPAILYALLVTRTHFLKEAERDLAYQGMNMTRAELCEILACKLLRTFSRDSMDLVAALCVALWPYTGADEETIDNAKRRYGEKIETRSTLLLAIQSSAKRFIATPLVQKVVDGIWEGQIVLGTTSTSRALIDDSYKIHPVSFYDPATAPFLDWHRLRVPKIRAFLDGANFVIVLILYVYCLRAKDQSKWTVEETLFSTWLIGITIGELAQMAEHGADTYFSSLFNVIDCVFCCIGGTWFVVRIVALATQDPIRSNFAFDVLALGSILLCPRLAALVLRDNILLMALREMVSQFFKFLRLASVFFAGFAWAFYSLADSPEWTASTISWQLLRLTFGYSLSIPEAQGLHPVFGPWLVLVFTLLSQTLLLTILISILSATFSRVAAHAREESMFEFAYLTLQGASTEALFSYYPPLNILCLMIIYPASFVVSPRWLHKLNVAVIRTTHLPILLGIRVFQQYSWRKGIELAAEKSGNVLNKVGWKTTRGQPDVLEAVFNDINDTSADMPSYLSDTGEVKPLSSTLSSKHVGSILQPSQQQQQSSGTPSSTIKGRLAAGHARFESDELHYPDSPGATIRKAKATTGQPDVVSVSSRLNRSTTFKDLPDVPRRRGKGQTKAENKSPPPRPPSSPRRSSLEVMAEQSQRASRDTRASLEDTAAAASEQGLGESEGRDFGSISPSQHQFPSTGSIRSKSSPERERRRSLSSFSSSVKERLHPRRSSRSSATLATLKSDDQQGDGQSATAEEEALSGTISPRLRRDTFDPPDPVAAEQVATPSVLLSLLERLDEQVQTVSRMEDAINRLAQKQERRELADSREEGESEPDEEHQDDPKGKGKVVD